MNIRSVNRIAMLTAVLSLCFVQTVPAEVALFGETAAKWYVCDRDGSKHPSTMEILQMVHGDYGHLDRFRLLFEYERALDLLDDDSAATMSEWKAAAKGKIQVTIRHLRDGSWTTLGKLKANVKPDGDAVNAYKDKVFRIDLERGDVLQWRFNLKKFSSVGEHEDFMIRTGIVAEDNGDEPAPAGQWRAQAGFGTFTLNVNSAFTRITNITYSFSSFSCGGVRVSGGVSISSSPGWEINNNEFTIVTDLDPSSAVQNMTIQGTFNEPRTEASGSWIADWYGDRCTGTWSGSPG